MNNLYSKSTKVQIKILLIIIILILITPKIMPGSPRVEVFFNGSWKFIKGNISNASDINFNDSSWEKVTLPHTWNNLDGQDGGNYYRGPAWYRKSFNLPWSYSGRKVFIQFGAASTVAEVYINGKFVGEHKGGYASFTFDITGFLKAGSTNIICVKVDNTSYSTSKDFQIAPLEGDFTMGGGLIRPVKLLVTDSVYISPLDYSSPGVYITQKSVNGAAAKLLITTKLKNDTKKLQNISIGTFIYNQDNSTVKQISGKAALPGLSGQDFKQEISLENPHLWGGRLDPYLYKVVVLIYNNNKLVDQVEQPLGLRYYNADPQKGFFLNGKPYKLHGFCMHEDKENTGRALSDADREEEVNTLLDIGATIVRMAHYQHAEEEYDLCDKNGIAVWTELPLVDCISSDTSFAANCKQQLLELIRQNYNHPSIFFWGIYNEINLVKGPDPLHLVKELNELAKKEDPTRYTTAAEDHENMPTALVTDILGLNKYFGWYYGHVQEFGKFLDDWHSKHPDRAIGISEYGAGGSIFQHDEVSAEPTINSSWHPEEYQTEYHEVCWKAIQERPYLWCSTLWNGFDFSSDHRSEGFKSGINDKGLIEQDHSTKKDSYNWYKVNWNPDPMIYLTSKRFTKRDTSVINIKAYSNCEEVELFINNISAGKRKADDHRFIWNDIKLNEGSNYFKVVTTANGKEIYDECWWRYK
jgi:beta-galactosidase